MAYLKSVSAGVKTDCETLLKKFVDKETVRFEDFVKIWKEMKFSLIYCGRESFMELWKFTQEALHIAKQFFLPPHPFQVRVGALYLLYGLYHKQMARAMVKIRITLDEWKSILNLVDRLEEEAHLDALMIFYKMVKLDDAFLFCAHPKELGFELGASNNQRERQDVLPVQSELEQMMEGEGVIEKIDALHKRYEMLKMSLQDAQPFSLDTSVNMIQPDLASDLQKLLDEASASKEEDQSNGLLEDVKPEIGSLRQKLKKKAFKLRGVYFRTEQRWTERDDFDDEAMEEEDLEQMDPSDEEFVP